MPASENRSFEPPCRGGAAIGCGLADRVRSAPGRRQETPDIVPGFRGEPRQKRRAGIFRKIGDDAPVARSDAESVERAATTGLVDLVQGPLGLSAPQPVADRPPVAGVGDPRVVQHETFGPLAVKLSHVAPVLGENIKAPKRRQSIVRGNAACPAIVGSRRMNKTMQRRCLKYLLHGQFLRPQGYSFRIQSFSCSLQTNR